MKISKKTKVKEVLPLLINSDRIEKLLEDIPQYPLQKDIISMTIGEFSQIVLNEESFIGELLKPNEKVLVAFGRLKTFRKQMENLGKYLEKFNIKQSQDELMAGRGIDFPTSLEKMLITVVQFFGLKSFDEAEKVKVCDYLLILKDNVSNVKFQRNYSKIIEQKSKMKSHGKNR